MSKQNLNKHLIGLTGEYFVAGMMSLKGWVASLTLKNYPSVDIFGLNPETEKTVNIQVKTIRGGKNYPTGLTHATIDNAKDKITCPYVFVHINKTDEVRYFIVSRKELIDIVKTSDKDYLNKPRKKPVQQTNPVAIPMNYLLPFENKWNNIWK
jgi:hypothetical protein